MNKVPKIGDTITIHGSKEQFIIIDKQDGVFSIRSKRNGSEFVCSLKSIEKIVDNICPICKREISGCMVCWWCGFDINGGPQ